MSQRTVESVIGRLVTDEEFRLRFMENRAAVVDGLAADGARLTPAERRTLMEMDFGACEKLAERLDPRLQKICLRRAKK